VIIELDRGQVGALIDLLEEEVTRSKGLGNDEDADMYGEIEAQLFKKFQEG